MGSNSQRQYAFLTGSLWYLLPVFSPAYPALEAFAGKCGIYEGKRRPFTEILEVGRNHFHFLVRQFHHSREVGRSLPGLPLAPGGTSLRDTQLWDGAC